MTDMRFEDLLERTMGLKAASIGPSAIRRAVDARIRSCNLESDHAYWALLQRSREELQELIEVVVVPETWFFRDPQAFAAMARIAAAQVAKRDGSRPLRLLSLPCSTGEEPYTMAMALLDAGLPADSFRIDAIDISSRSLTQARLGVYGRNSFRSLDLTFRDRHFAAVERGYRISDAVRAPVHFFRGNIADTDFLAGVEAYDFIFCRNLLIYFDGPLQNRAIDVLKRLLAPEGVLFVGHSETGLMAANGLASAKIPMAFAFRTAPAQPCIEELRRIADSGRLEEAARGCESHMRQRGPSPDALLLLALISDASGDSFAAANYYRKVLYLEPGNSEALGHLALLLRRQGDHAGAKLLDDRMRRHVERSIR